MIKVKMNIGFTKFKKTRFSDIETAIAWVRKNKISNTQLRDSEGNEWDNF